MDDLRLGTILLCGGIVDESDLERCLAIQELTGGVRPLGQILCEQGLIDERTLDRLLDLQREQRATAQDFSITVDGLATQALLRSAHANNAEELVISEGRNVRMKVAASWHDLTEEPLRGPEVWDFVREMLGTSVLEELADRHFVARQWQLEGAGRGMATAFRQFDGVAVRVTFAAAPSTSEQTDEPQAPAAVTADILPAEFSQRLRSGRGLVLLVGERGIGRSSGLEAALHNVAGQGQQYVVYVGDEPIAVPASEALIAQRKFGWSTAERAAAMRSAIREDPDILLCADVGAPETFELALRAAEGGRLVIAYLDAGRVKDALARILNFYPNYDLPRVRSSLAAVLRAVLARHQLPDANHRGAVYATELLLVEDPAREILRGGKIDDITLLLRMEDDAAGHSLDRSMFQLLTDGKVRMPDIFARCEEKAWLLERTQNLETKEI
ncbi:MAG: Flp pilus assembly complex ATPase component TadA [Planctomycetes bacterium]|nr:Flp pilus assembly complex ATPase component TadA [Planctomycetota bacterium]MCB9884114.1 Flp pilus assembly complex ATPase component TadA [Planctomycetota bacterium]